MLEDSLQILSLVLYNIEDWIKLASSLANQARHWASRVMDANT